MFKLKVPPNQMTELLLTCTVPLLPDDSNGGTLIATPNCDRNSTFIRVSSDSYSRSVVPDYEEIRCIRHNPSIDTLNAPSLHHSLRVR